MTIGYALRWLTGQARALALLAAVALALPSAHALPGSGIQCMPSGIVVSGGGAEDRSNACAAIEEALHMLATMGMRSTGHVAIDLVHEIPPDGNQHTLGYFDGERNVIILLDYEASVAGSKAHNTWMDRALWRSYLAHELAHAVAFENDTAGRLSLSAHE